MSDKKKEHDEIHDTDEPEDTNGPGTSGVTEGPGDPEPAPADDPEGGVTEGPGKGE